MNGFASGCTTVTLVVKLLGSAERVHQRVQVRAADDVARLERGRGLEVAPRRRRAPLLAEQHVGERKAARVVEREDEMTGETSGHLGSAAHA